MSREARPFVSEFPFGHFCWFQDFRRKMSAYLAEAIRDKRHFSRIN